MAELLYEIEDDFRIKILDEDMKRMDGTVDAIVRYMPPSGVQRQDVEDKFQLSDRKLESGSDSIRSPDPRTLPWP